jgi:hypothetical protein
MTDWPGVDSRVSREALLTDLASSVRFWQAAARSALSNRSEVDEELVGAVTHLRARLSDEDDAEAFDQVVLWVLSGLAHSLLVTLDGGSASCPSLELRDPDSRSLGSALHEEWPEFDPREN